MLIPTGHRFQPPGRVLDVFEPVRIQPLADGQGGLRRPGAVGIDTEPHLRSERLPEQCDRRQIDFGVRGADLELQIAEAVFANQFFAEFEQFFRSGFTAFAGLFIFCAGEDVAGDFDLPAESASQEGQTGFPTVLPMMSQHAISIPAMRPCPA